MAVFGNSGAGIEKRNREYHFTRLLFENEPVIAFCEAVFVNSCTGIEKSPRLFILRGCILKIPLHLKYRVAVFENFWAGIDYLADLPQIHRFCYEIAK